VVERNEDVKMAKWNYKLEEEGLKLRELTFTSKEAETIEQIEVCCRSLLKQLTNKDKEYYEDKIEDLLNLIAGEADTIRNNPDEITKEWDFKDIEELVNSRLSEFYDICDDCRCWVQM